MYPRSAAGTGARLRCGGRPWMRLIMETFSVGLAEIDGPGVGGSGFVTLASPTPARSALLLSSPLRLLRRCRTSPSRCANHHRPVQAPLTNRDRGPSLRERGRDYTEPPIWPRSWAPRSRRDPRVLVAKGGIPHRRRRLPRSHTEDAPTDAQAPVTPRRTLDLRAGLSSPRARGRERRANYLSVCPPGPPS